MVFTKLGAAQGFEHGWFDGLNNKPLKLRPDATLALLGPDYLDAYRNNYNDGYQTAERELFRAEQLLVRKSMTPNIELERDDV